MPRLRVMLFALIASLVVNGLLIGTWAMFDGKTEVPGAIDEAKRMDVVIGIDAIPGI